MSKLKPHEKRSICSAEAPASMALTPPSPAPSPPPGETSRSKTHIFCFAPEDHKFIKIRWRPTAPSPAPSLVSDLPNAGTSARPQMGFSKDTTFPPSPDTPPRTRQWPALFIGHERLIRFQWCLKSICGQEKRGLSTAGVHMARSRIGMHMPSSAHSLEMTIPNE